MRNVTITIIAAATTTIVRPTTVIIAFLFTSAIYCGFPELYISYFGACCVAIFTGRIGSEISAQTFVAQCSMALESCLTVHFKQGM